MKKSKIWVVALIGLLLAGSLFIMGCEELAYAVGSQLANTSCALEYDCNGNSYFCGRTTCGASKIGSNTRCACL
jgi:hypothetical protein